MAKEMGKKINSEPWREPLLGSCACAQLRRAARSLSAFYDRFLSVSGLTVTQYAVLVNVGRTEKISRTKLAKQMGMERTTLTRNLRPLEQQLLIQDAVGLDRRERVLQLTKAGMKRLNQSYPYWEQAQASFLLEFGQKRFEELKELLLDTERATQSV